MNNGQQLECKQQNMKMYDCFSKVLGDLKMDKVDESTIQLSKGRTEVAKPGLELKPYFSTKGRESLLTLGAIECENEACIRALGKAGTPVIVLCCLLQ